MGSAGGLGGKINEGNFGRGQNDFIDTFIDVNDPFDIMGTQADMDQQEISDILMKSAQAGIAQSERQEQFVRDKYQPYYDQGVGAMGKLSALYTGEGDSGYKPSAMFDYQKEKGLENIAASSAKMGLLDSSARQEQDIGLVSSLASEDINRYESGLLSQVQMGSGAADAVSAAGTATSGAIGSLYSSLGAGLNASQQAYGQARQASMQTAGNTLMNLSTYQAQG